MMTTEEPSLPDSSSSSSHAVVTLLPSLRHLSLASSDVLPLADSLCLLSTLTRLDLEHCNDCASLPAALSSLASLRHVHLTRCAALLCLPLLPGQLPALRCLEVVGCPRLLLPEHLRAMASVKEW